MEIMARPMVATSTAAIRHILPKVSGVVVDVSLAFGVFIIGLPSVFRAPTGNRHVAVPMLFDIAFALPLIWRRRSTRRLVSRAGPLGDLGRGRCALAPRCLSLPAL